MEDELLVMQYNEKADQLNKAINLLPAEKLKRFFDALDYIDEKRAKGFNETDYRKEFKKTLKGFKEYNLLSKEDFNLLSRFFDVYYLWLSVESLVSSDIKWVAKVNPSLFLKYRMTELNLNRISLSQKSGVGESTINKLLNPTTSMNTWLKMEPRTSRAIFNALKLDENFNSTGSIESANMFFWKAFGLLEEDEENDTIMLEDLDDALQILCVKYQGLKREEAYLIYKNFDVYWDLDINEWDAMTTVMEMDSEKKRAFINAIESAERSVSYKPNVTEKYHTYKRLMKEDHLATPKDFEIELLRCTINNKFAKLENILAKRENKIAKLENSQQFIDFSERLLIYPKIQKNEWQTLAYLESIQKMPELKNKFVISLHKYK